MHTPWPIREEYSCRPRYNSMQIRRQWYFNVFFQAKLFFGCVPMACLHVYHWGIKIKYLFHDAETQDLFCQYWTWNMKNTWKCLYAISGETSVEGEWTAEGSGGVCCRIPQLISSAKVTPLAISLFPASVWGRLQIFWLKWLKVLSGRWACQSIPALCGCLLAPLGG